MEMQISGEPFAQLLGRNLTGYNRFSTTPDLYTDPGHFNRSGTNLVMQWLSGSMNPYLEPLVNQTSSLKVIPSYH